jgi:hypothetical protein
MPRDALTPADLLGRIDALTVECVKCERRGRYRVRTLVREIGFDGNIANWLFSLSADCPHSGSRAIDFPFIELSRLSDKSMRILPANRMVG